MKRIALVNHRYGVEVSGGSETLCRILAKKLCVAHEICVITTCAIDDNTWENYYPEGENEIEGIKVYRFRTVKNRDWAFYDRLNEYVDKTKHHVIEDEIQWIIDQGPYSPALFDYIHNNYNQYDAIIFMTYLYYTSAICMLGIPNAIFMPTAHDEKAIQLPFYRETFSWPLAYIFLTQEECDFVKQRFPFIKNKDYVIGAYGVEHENVAIPKKADSQDTYILYAGRIHPAKGCDKLFEYFLQFIDKNKKNIQLYLIGKNDMEIPRNERIRYIGFVTECEKMQIMKNASLLVLPSEYESLSIVVLEALSVGTPVLVNDRCNVTVGHVKRSNAGYTYGGYESFEHAINEVLLREDDYIEKQYNAQVYIRNNYSWDFVLKSLEKIIDKIKFTKFENNDSAVKVEECYSKKIEPAFLECNIPIVLASDDNYVEVLSVALQSIISSAIEYNNYDIIILSDKISEFNKTQLLLQKSGRNNIKIRFLEVSEYLNEYTFKFTNKRISRATFMRLLIVDLLPCYDKIVYLDCDIIVQKDIGELYQIDIGGKYFGAVVDPHISQMWKYRKNFFKHLKEEVKLSDPNKYFNAGILVMNLEMLRTKYTSKKLLEIAVSRKWMWEDQDVLNFISVNKVKFLDRKWNVLWVACPRVMQIMKTNVAYMEALSAPWIIHYAGGVMPISRYGEMFYWDYVKNARLSPFYEIIALKIQDNYKAFKNSKMICSQNLSRGKKLRVLFKKAKEVFKNYGGFFLVRCGLVCTKELILSPKGQRFIRMRSVYRAMKSRV